VVLETLGRTQNQQKENARAVYSVETV